MFAMMGKEVWREKGGGGEGLDRIRLKICHAKAGVLEFLRSALLSFVD